MQVMVDIPDEFADLLIPDDEDPARTILEDRTARAYRDGRLTTYQVQCILDLPSRMDVDPFLLKYGIFDYTVAMLEGDLKHLESIRG